MSYAGSKGRVRGGALALLVTMGGCAGPYVYTRPSTEQIASADEAVRVARAKGAETDPQAMPFFKAAERQLAAGKRSLEQGDDSAATFQLARAAADGELSQAMVEKSRQEREATVTEAQLAETRSQVAAPPRAPQ
jgi:hypothetical protein